MNIIEKAGVSDTREVKEISFGNNKIIKKVYSIPIEYLRYNQQNDRIIVETNGIDFNKLTPVEADEKIENFIWNDNEASNIKTKTGIKHRGQIEAGIVTSDGIVVDGNRRLTCLRRLEKEKAYFSHFKGIILTAEECLDKKSLKILELQIQHGNEEKVDYNPINKAIAAYQDIVIDKLFTAKHYAEHIGETEKHVLYLIGKGELLHEFLEYANEPENFKLARTLKLDGPIHDIQMARKEMNDESIQFLFNFMLTKNSNTDWKKIRDLINSLKVEGSKTLEIVAENEEKFEKVHEILHSDGFSSLKKDNLLMEEMDDVFENILDVTSPKIAKVAFKKELKYLYRAIKKAELELYVSTYENSEYENEFIDLMKLIQELNRSLNEKH